MAVKQKTSATKAKGNPTKGNVINWIAEALLLRDLEQASNLVLYTKRLNDEERHLLFRLVRSARRIHNVKYKAYQHVLWNS